MFSDSIMWYLFFAGVGSGLSCVVFVADSYLRRFNPSLFITLKPLLLPSIASCLLLVAFGSVFLLFDLGRAERLLILFLEPSFSILSIGTWSLLAYLLLTGTQLLVRLRFSDKTPQILHIVIRWANMLSALAVMLYTGLLLQSLGAVHFWATPLLPLLFMLSSLSSGLAFLLLIAFFKQAENVTTKVLVRLFKVHLPLLICEALVLTVYLSWAFQRSTTAAASAMNLLSGDYLLIFWGGVVLCGLILPVILEARARQKASHSLMAAHALILLAGALALRYCFLEVGMHPHLYPSLPFL